MRQPHHEFFYICIGIALFCVIFLIVVCRIFYTYPSIQIPGKYLYDRYRTAGTQFFKST